MEDWLFSGILDAAEIEEITQLPEASQERADKAIEMLGRYLKPPEGLAGKICRVYGGPEP